MTGIHDLPPKGALEALLLHECRQGDHLAHHGRILADICLRYGLDAEFADTIADRWPIGFDHHGEYNHHVPEFTPLLEAYFEISDYIDLLGVHPRERVELGIAEPLATAEQRALYHEALMHAVASANALSRLLRAVGNDA